MMNWSIVLFHGCVGGLLATLALLPIGFKDPRIMLQDYPKSIQAVVPPKSKLEKKQTFIYGLPFLLVLFLYPLAIGLYYNLHSDMSYGQTLLLTGGMLQVFNLYDLLILDWLIFCTITPKLVVVPGTEGNKGYKDYKFHFIGFLKGIVITAVLAVIISLLVKGILILSANFQIS